MRQELSAINIFENSFVNPRLATPRSLESVCRAAIARRDSDSPAQPVAGDKSAEVQILTPPQTPSS
jgi:hypothetical protein